MDYLSIIKRAFQISYKNKFLWILGFLAALTEGGGGFNFGSFNSSNVNSLRDLWQQNNGQTPPLNIPATNIVKEKVLGETANSDWTLIGNWFSENLNLIIIIGVILIVLMIIIMVISKMAKGGLIWAVAEFDKDKKTNFKQSFKKGFWMFWKIFGIEIVVGLLVIAAMMVYAIPIIFLIVFNLYAAGIIWGVVLILPLVLFCIFLGILRMYALRYAAVDGETICNSLRESWLLFRKKLKDVLLIWLISIGLGILVGIVTVIVYLVVLVIFFAIGFGLYMAGGMTAVIVTSIVLGLAFLVLIVVVSGFIHSFISAYWTLAFVELKK